MTIIDDELAPDDEVAGATSATRRQFTSSEEAASARRIREGNPLQAQRVIPSDAPMPLDAQRDFRGRIVIAILLLIVLGVCFTLLLTKKVAGRTIVYAPTAERVGAATTSREPTAFEIRQQSQWLLLRMECWTPSTVGAIWKDMVPYLHPQLHEKIRRDYEQLEKQAEQLWQSRVAIPLGVALTDASAGQRAVAVFYDQIELTGRNEAERKLTAVVPKAAYIQFVYETPTKENPSGLLVTHYAPKSREQWLADGLPDLWEAFRKKPDANAKK